MDAEGRLMAREFGSMAAFAAHLGTLAAVELAAQHDALERSARLVEETAKKKIGHEQAYWPPLAESTIADKERRGYDAPSPLLRTGAMRDSIEHTASISEAYVGSNNDDAVWQELGTVRGIPPRSFLASSAIEKEKEVVEIVGAEVTIALSGGAVGAPIIQKGPRTGSSE